MFQLGWYSGENADGQTRSPEGTDLTTSEVPAPEGLHSMCVSYYLTPVRGCHSQRIAFGIPLRLSPLPVRLAVPSNT